MSSIIRVNQISNLREKLKRQNQTIVLVGGCFDILHPGHVVFLQKAKKEADLLVVLLESDEKVKKLKGKNRPVHTQLDRAKVLSALKVVDYVVMMPNMENEKEYDELIYKIKPDIIALTKGYSNPTYHKRSAKFSGAKLKYVTEIIGNHSSSKILNHNKGS